LRKKWSFLWHLRDLILIIMCDIENKCTRCVAGVYIIHGSCQTCDGKGKLDCYKCGASGTYTIKDVCRTCKGSDKVSCFKCNGTGRHKNSRCNKCQGNGSFSCPNKACVNGTFVRNSECLSCGGIGSIACFNKRCAGGMYTYYGDCRVCSGTGVCNT